MARIPLAGALARYDRGHPQGDDIVPRDQLYQTQQLMAKVPHVCRGPTVRRQGAPVHRPSMVNLGNRVAVRAAVVLHAQQTTMNAR